MLLNPRTCERHPVAWYGYYCLRRRCGSYLVDQKGGLGTLIWLLKVASCSPSSMLLSSLSDNFFVVAVVTTFDFLTGQERKIYD